MKCPRCRRTIPAQDSFCAYCGAPIVAARTPVRSGRKWLLVLLGVGVAAASLYFIPPLRTMLARDTTEWPPVHPGSQPVLAYSRLSGAVSVHPAKSLYVQAPPVIDGTLTPGEWGSASITKPIQYSRDGVERTGDVRAYFANDSENLYVAVTVGSDDLRSGLHDDGGGYRLEVSLWLNSDDSELTRPGQRFRKFVGTEFQMWCLTGDGSFSHLHSVHVTGAAAYSHATHTHMYECVVPLDSADPLDLAVQAGDTIRAKVIVSQSLRISESAWRILGQWGWPTARDRIDKSTYGTLVLASGPEPPDSLPAQAGGPPPGDGESAAAGWPTLQCDFRRTSRSPYAGPDSPVLRWALDDQAHLTEPLVGTDGTVYYPSRPMAVNPDGNVKWRFPDVSADRGSLGPDNTLYFSATRLQGGNHVCAVGSDGSLKWKTPTDYNPGWSAPVVAPDGTVYATLRDVSGDDERAFLWALSHDGSLKWEMAIEGGTYGSPALCGEGNIHLLAGLANLLVVSPSGEVIRTISLGSVSINPAPAPLIASDGTIYLVANDVLVALYPDGALKWEGPAVGYNVGALGLGPDGTVVVNASRRTGPADHRRRA